MIVTGEVLRGFGRAAAVSVAMLPVLIVLVFAATALMQRPEDE